MTTDFGFAILEHLPTLRIYARRLTRNDMDGDDLVQDTVLKALTNQTRWSPDHGSLLQWLSTLCYHQFIDGVRRAKRATAYLEATTPDTSTCASQDDVVVLREMVTGFETLPQQQRRMIMLAAIGETYLAIGRKMNLPRGTTASRLHRARRALAEAAMQRRQFDPTTPALASATPAATERNQFGR
jgi:RNA polymerase sigma-70 factor (ECF subfamily)